MVLYFTGTGNSEYCARFIADRLGEECFDLAERIKKKDFSPLESEKSWVICVPTYAWRIPTVVKDFISETELRGNKDIYFVMTCGGEVGKAEKYNKKLCEEKGMKYKGTAEIKMPENYIAMFEVTDEKTEDSLLENADLTLESVSEKILRGEKLPEVKTGSSSAFLSGPVNTLFYSLYVKDKSFSVKKNCTSCGLCAKKCPLGNIEMKGGKPQWLGNCTHCMACICHCPVEAIEYGKKSEGKRRYICRRFEA